MAGVGKGRQKGSPRIPGRQGLRPAKTATGTPTKCTPEAIQRAGQLAAEGHYLVTIAGLIGIGERTMTTWYQKGQAGIAPFDAFVQAVEAGHAAAEAEALRSIRAAGIEDWHAAAWFLERKANERWGRKDRHAHAVMGLAKGEIVLSWSDDGKADAIEAGDAEDSQP
ncbi:MAG: hypothetical protein EBX40_00020 [Gammaproteobacteria bacterium]|nr:hypothetical protein [Gammaproteobacteria bacterium]